MKKLTILNEENSGPIVRDLTGPSVEKSGVVLVSQEEAMAIEPVNAHAAMTYLFPVIAQYANWKSMAKALLSRNAKLLKTAAGNLRTTGLTLLPASSIAGLNSCVGASIECILLCLKGSGHNVIPVNDLIKACRHYALLLHTPEFLRLLIESIRMLPKNYRIRLNVLSDLPWEILAPWLFTLFPERKFYDYTKVTGRKPPANYKLVLSFSGRNWDACRDYLARGESVAIVSQTLARPDFMIVDGKQYFTVDGDIHDIRTEDPDNCIVWLKYKTTAGNKGKREEVFLWENFIAR